MITKAEVRAVSLSLLAISRGDIVWDVVPGRVVALEAASFVDSGFVYAIERDARQRAHIEDNLQRHTGPLRLIAGESPTVLSEVPDPDAVFLGIRWAAQCAARGDHSAAQARGCLIANFAPLTNLEIAPILQRLGWSVQVVQIQVNRGTEDGRLSARNPVHILSARKP